jgi:hypothetical protein
LYKKDAETFLPPVSWGVRLHRSTARLRDQIQSTVKRDRCHSLAPVLSVYKKGR